jgi:hypothetical protein
MLLPPKKTHGKRRYSLPASVAAQTEANSVVLAERTADPSRTAREIRAIQPPTAHASLGLSLISQVKVNATK